MDTKKILAEIMVFAIGACAGVTNPDLSVIGQILGGWTDDPASADKDHATLHLGEVELVADAPLNPYAKGVVVLTASETGASVEETYASLDDLLPLGLAVKAGKYRAPFGKINPMHPHALPFVEPPRLLRPETGLSLGTGTTNVAAGTRSTVAGADLKLKFFLDGRTRLLLQGEWLRRWSQDASWNVSTDTYAKTDIDRQGSYGFFDLARDRWDGGVLFEAYDARTGGIDQAVKAFAGFGLMEETTLFRLTFEHFTPHSGPSVNSVGGQLLFSMGPHKPHAF